jgi:hypothetical protein
VKFLTILFAFYILILPCIPCEDINICKDNTKSEVTSTTTEQHESSENEKCNPFCSCACCGQILYPNFQYKKEAAASKPLGNPKQQFLYINITLSSNFFGNIWQPPKFS